MRKRRNREEAAGQLGRGRSGQHQTSRRAHGQLPQQQSQRGPWFQPAPEGGVGATANSPLLHPRLREARRCWEAEPQAHRSTQADTADGGRVTVPHKLLTGLRRHGMWQPSAQSEDSVDPRAAGAGKALRSSPLPPVLCVFNPPGKQMLSFCLRPLSKCRFPLLLNLFLGVLLWW